MYDVSTERLLQQCPARRECGAWAPTTNRADDRRHGHRPLHRRFRRQARTFASGPFHSRGNHSRQNMLRTTLAGAILIQKRAAPLVFPSPARPMLMATNPCSARSLPPPASTKLRLLPAVFPRVRELQPWTGAWRTLTSQKTACSCSLHRDRRTPVAKRSV